MGPVAGAIAAGNCVVIKPSEVAPASAKFMAETIPKYLDNVSVNCQINGNKVPEYFGCPQFLFFFSVFVAYRIAMKLFAVVLKKQQNC